MMERAAFLPAWHDKKLTGMILGISGAKGNAATRIEASVAKGGLDVGDSVPEIDDLFQRQARELDRKKRETLLHQLQKLTEERVAPHPGLRSRPSCGAWGRASRSPARRTRT